jgi:replicative DNA helicase
MLSFAGDGNVGKSALVQNLGLRVADRNDDVCVLLFTIDDTRSQVLPRLVSQLTGIPINTVCQPERYNLKQEQTDKISNGWNTVERLMREGRFDIKDASHSATISFAEGWIDHVRNQYPERNILFVLDNFHRLRGVPGSGERERLEGASDAIFMLTKTKGITAICTMELRKRESPSSRPRIEDLKGSKRFEYDNSVIVMMHNPMHSKLQYDADKDAWQDDDGLPKPILQAYFDKNKVTSFKGMIPFRFRTDTSQILSRYDDNRQFVGGTPTDPPGEIPD